MVTDIRVARGAAVLQSSLETPLSDGENKTGRREGKEDFVKQSERQAWSGTAQRGSDSRQWSHEIVKDCKTGRSVERKGWAWLRLN